MVQFIGRRHSIERNEEDLSFSMCKNLVQVKSESFVYIMSYFYLYD
uniref:Uncharacterized protein n=1 Tax=Nelumbo nucifera TaxID=4432 RepID=A0A822XIN7_NELNU|nr:TPA_asm: hypothetical protein HUJ06_020454 [Nelumbo nucifera]